MTSHSRTTLLRTAARHSTSDRSSRPIFTTLNYKLSINYDQFHFITAPGTVSKRMRTQNTPLANINHDFPTHPPERPPTLCFLESTTMQILPGRQKVRLCNITGRFIILRNQRRSFAHGSSGRPLPHHRQFQHSRCTGAQIEVSCKPLFVVIVAYVFFSIVRYFFFFHFIGL